jgi:hypothetical protein
VLLRYNGRLVVSGDKQGFETIHSFDCEEIPRVTLSDRNALCRGEGKDGINSGVHHSGVRSPDSMSIVFQLVTRDRGKAFENDCLVVLQAIKKVVTNALGSGDTLLTNEIEILGQHLDP